MSLVRWDPWREMDTMPGRYMRPKSWLRGQDVLTTGDWSPQVDIEETDKEFLIKVD